MKLLKLVLPAMLLALSVNANATVVNTLNGQQYEWLELTETTSMSRSEVEADLSFVNSSLYGYEYASRSLVEDLFLSYTSWDGLSGNHGDADVLTGISSLINDFGFTEEASYVATTYNTVDGYSVLYNHYYVLQGFMGTSSECGIGSTCRAYTNLFDNNGASVMGYQSGTSGWDSTTLSPWSSADDSSYATIGSFLVKPSVVPVPAAAWLFGSALLGFFGFSRRKAKV